MSQQGCLRSALDAKHRNSDAQRRGDQVAGLHARLAHSTLVRVTCIAGGNSKCALSGQTAAEPRPR